MRVRLTPSQACDAPQAESLLAELCPCPVLADRAYDAYDLRRSIVARGRTGDSGPVPPHGADRL